MHNITEAIHDLLFCLLFLAYGIYILIKSFQKSPDIISEEDGGKPSLIFFTLCQMYYYFKNEKKYSKNFPDNYFTILKFIGFTFIIAALFFICLILSNI